MTPHPAFILPGYELYRLSLNSDQVTYYKGYDHDVSGLPGFFKVEKHYETEIRDISGEIVIPFTSRYVYFYAVAGSKGYFECDYGTGYNYHPLFYDIYGNKINLEIKDGDKVYYRDNVGFVICDDNYKVKETLGVKLDKNGFADYSLAQKRQKEKEMRQKEKEVRKRQRQEFWTNLGISFLQLTAASLSSTSAAHTPFSYSKPIASVSDINIPVSDINTKNFNQAYQNLMSLSILQFQQQEQAQFNQARLAYLQMGKDLTIDEFRSLQGQALVNLTESDESFSITRDAHMTNTNLKERKQNILNNSVGDVCGACKGNRKCHACNGSKIVSRMGVSYACTVCNDEGDCPVCHGTGLASWN